MKQKILFTVIIVAISLNSSHAKSILSSSPFVYDTAETDSTRLSIPATGTVFTLSGLNFNLYNYIPQIFGGIFAAPPYTMVKINYPASLAPNSIIKGVEKLDAALKATPVQKMVVAHSQGAQVCSRWMREHATDPQAPPPGELIFILAGNPLRSAGGGYIIGRREVGGTIGEPTPTSTPWRIIDVARRYDGWADWVQDESNALAVDNAKKGKRTFHVHYEDVNLFDTTHTIWKKDNTTYVLTEEKTPPLMQGKRATTEEIKKVREEIETAYKRP